MTILDILDKHLKPGSLLKIIDKYVYVPPDAREMKYGDLIKPLELDGMYVNCSYQAHMDQEPERVYIAWWTEVEIYETS